MNTITLPDELAINSALSLKIYNYKTTEEISKQQVLLNKNTFSFLQEGTKKVFFDDSTFTINNDQFLLMKSGNCLMTEKLSHVKEYYRSILLFFSNEDVLKFIRKHELTPPKSKTYYSTYSFNYDSFIKKFAESLLDLSEHPKEFQSRILYAKFEEIMLYLIEIRGVDFLYSIINSNINHNQKFIKTIESNQLNKLTIKELSFLCNMSESKFKREFKKYFKSSPSKWFQEKRLKHAAFLLQNKATRPSDIFLEVGYETLSNFIQAFKTEFGQTPKQYQSN